MGYETVLVDALWDTQIGYEGIERLAQYAKSKGVALYLWYNPTVRGMMLPRDRAES